MNPPTPKRRRAFTLIEAVASIVIIGAIGASAARVIVTAADGYGGAAVQAQVHADLSVALDRLVREFHNIPCKAGATATPDISSLSATAMTWNTDYSLSLASGNLSLTIDGGSASVLLSNVTSLSIQAFDESNAALGASLTGSQCDAVRRILVTITVTRSGVSDTLRAKTFLRSTMSRVGG